MHFSISIHQYLTCLFIILPFFFSLSLSDPRLTEAALICSDSRFHGADYITNYIKLMESMSAKVATQGWGSVSITSPSPQIFAFSQCHEDLSRTECQLCFAQIGADLPNRCPRGDSARIYLDGCFFRFDNYSFFGDSIDREHDFVKCSQPTGVPADNYIKLELTKKAGMAIKDATEGALRHEGFGVGAVKGGGVYALAQCWKTLDSKGCSDCLVNAGQRVLGCAPGGEGRAMNAGCYLRYSTQRFFSVDTEAKGGTGLSNLGITIAIVITVVAISTLSFFGAFLGYVRVVKREQENNNLSQIQATVNKSNLHFKYEVLEKATNFFDVSRKLGQGGAGSVFKGTLPDGRDIAVKKLFYNTRQWVDEFFNEVNLISGIRHKNLVKLLGCSIEGPESLLVYEYVPNRNLDQILSDKNKTQSLRWQQRMEIIFGTASGLVHLHGSAGSTLKIIHRDIKGSNILLDENLIPKIADFGLARCVAGDKSHISTGIAGTLGYMAPEYLVRGQLTEKADVYAYGVVVLEVVCGRKNSVFTHGSDSVLQTVWKHYKSSSLAEVVDPSLKGEFSRKEASNVLQVGLLCTQASAALRPSMFEVVQMLNDKEAAIPSPKQPPFLNSSVLVSDDSARSSDVDSFVSKRNTGGGFSSLFNNTSTMSSLKSNDPSLVATFEPR